jgi:murein biosynthesis integral membrane protein MurJ
MSQFKTINSLSTTSMRLAAVRLKSSNKYIFRALLSLSSAALLTRMAGMVNQVVSSSHFGAGAMMDAYFVAYTLPTVLAALIVGAIEAAVVPAYTRVRSQGNKEHASRLFSTTINLFVGTTLLLTIFLILFRRQTIFLTAPALDPFRAGEAADLVPFMYPVLVLMVAVGLLECIFNVEGQFGWPAYAGLLVPLTTAAVVVIMGNSQGVVVLCVGMVLGLILQLGVFIIRAKRAKLVYRLVLDLHMPEIGSIFVAFWPTLIGGLIGQAGPLVDQIFASLLSSGSISALSYALKIVSVFSGVIFVSVGRAAFPYLSRHAANNDLKSFKSTLRLYLWGVGMCTGVLSIFILLFAHPIVQVLFQRGAFSPDDTNRTTMTFIGFIFGLTPMALGFIGARAFSALGKNKVLIWVSAFSVTANAVFDYIFAHFWQSQGIALSTSAVYFCTMFILFITLSRKIGKLDLLTPPTELLTFVSKIKLFLLDFFSGFDKKITYIGIMIAVFAVGIIGNLLNSSYTLRIALGSVIIVALLRYRYLLLIAWVTLDAFIGSTLPFFNGNHFDTGLTVPTLLLMLYLPVRLAFKRMSVLFFLFLYLLWVFASIGISSIGVGSFLTTWLTYLDYLAVAVLTIHEIATRRHLQRIIDIILLEAGFVSLYGLYGYFTRQNGVVDPTTSLFRIYSIFSAAPPFALFLSVVIPLAMYRVFTLSGFKRVGMTLLLLLMLVATSLTFSRGALISVPLSIVIFVLFLPSRKIKLVLLTWMAVLAGSVAILVSAGNVSIFSRFFNQDVTTLNGRTLLWQALLSHFNPGQLLGNGLGASNILLANLQVGLNGGLIATAPSNLYLGILYDHGIIGLALLLLMFVVLFTGIVRGIRGTKGDQRLLFVVALSILVNVLIQSLEVDDFWTQSIGLYLWIIMALPFALCWRGIETVSNKGDDISDKATVPQMQAIIPTTHTPTFVSGFTR